MIRTRLGTLCGGLTALLVCASTAFPTTVVPLTFDEIVSSAQAIFLGEAVQVRSDWETSPRGKHIVTTVRFKVERVLKGQVDPEVRLQFLGGEIAGLVMEVDQMPRFQVGSRDVLFLSGTRDAVSPLVGFFSGRFRVTADRAGGSARVMMHDGRPFAPAVAATSRTRSLLPRTSATMTYGDFESLVLTMLARSASVAR